MTTQFIQGKVYEADINLTLGQSLLATNGIIAEKLKEAGFLSISVSGSGKIRKAQGTWSKPTEEVDVNKLVSTVVINNITEL